MLVSCEDNDPTENNIRGEWKYRQPHFEFDYLYDTLKITTNPMQPPFTLEVKKLKPIFMQMAPLLQDYFKGIHIGNGTAEIRMSAGYERPYTLESTYRIDENYLEITLDPESLKQLSGGKFLEMPPISFSYRLESDHRLLLYLNKSYIGILLRTVMGNEQMRAMILPVIIPNYDRIPERVLPMVIESLNTQITTILDNTNTLEIGFFFSLQ